MRSFAAADHLKTCAAIVGVGLLAACGGGNAVGGSLMAAVNTSFVEQHAAKEMLGNSDPDEQASSAAGGAGHSDAEDRLSIPWRDGTTATTVTSNELITIRFASIDPAASLSDADLPPDATVANAEPIDEVPSGRNAVKTLAASAPAEKFVRFTQEGHSFTVPKNTLLRFGDAATDRWVTKTASGYGECNNQFFRGDPASGVPKVCQFWAANAEVIAQLTGPTWSPRYAEMPIIDLSRIPTPWIGFSEMRVQPTAEIAPANDIGAFRTGCGVAKLSFDDPIVYPGQVGKSHLHTFFGNTGVNANSTADSLRNTGSSTCLGGIANRSAYWVPTIIDTRTGAPLIATGNGVYYKAGYDVPSSTIRPIPAGLRMIAGNPGATTPGSQGYRFRCIGGPNGENDKYGPQIGNCDGGATLIQEIFFPQCWDGVNLDSPDHKSHMAYQNNGKCPADHPVALPAITYNVEYVVPNKDDALHWRLSSDNYDSKLPGGYSSHGDWFNGWKSEISDAWGKHCVAAVKDCHSHLLGDGRMMY